MLTELRRRLGLLAPSIPEKMPENDLNTVVHDTIPEMTDAERERYIRFHTSNQHGR